MNLYSINEHNELYDYMILCELNMHAMQLVFDGIEMNRA